MASRENPDAAPPVNATKPAAAAVESREPESLATAPEAVLLENPRAVVAPPSESMEGVVTVERELEPAGFLRDVQSVNSGSNARVNVRSGVSTPDEPTTLENPRRPTPAPTEGSADVVTLETSRPAPPAPALLVNAAPAPAQPRLRTSFYYDGAQLRCELVMMTATREPVHRETFDVQPGSTFAQLHALLLATATIRAQHTGRIAADAPSEVPRPNATDLVAFVADEPAPAPEAEQPPTTQREP